MCMGTVDNCYNYELTTDYANAAAVFGSSHIRTTNLDKRAFTDLYLSVDDPQYNRFWAGYGGGICSMQRPGFSTQCNDNNWARWGYCGNLPDQACQSSDGSDADFAVGIGLKLQNYPWSANSGSNEYFLDSGSNVDRLRKQVWLFTSTSSLNNTYITTPPPTAAPHCCTNQHWGHLHAHCCSHLCSHCCAHQRAHCRQLLHR
jgi:hypothetical protein